MHVLTFYLVGNMSMGRREAYEWFRRDYEHNDTIESNKRTLKQLCVEAKQLGEQLAESRNKISTCTILWLNHIKRLVCLLFFAAVHIGRLLF